MPIDYAFDTNHADIHGETCPICGKKSWKIFKCGKCGKIFCASCRPDLVKEEEEDMIEVTCDCGNKSLFVDI